MCTMKSWCNTVNIIHRRLAFAGFGNYIELNFSPPGDYCNLPLYMKSDPFFRKQSEHHDPCPVVPPREASIRGLAQRAYHTQGRHVTMDSAKQQALSMGHSGLSNLTSSGASSGATGGGGGSITSASSSSSTLPQRTLTMPGSSASVAQSAAAAAAATAAAAGVSSSSGGGGVAGAAGGTPGGASSSSSKMGGSRDSLLESSSSGLGRLQKQRDGGAGAYSKSYTLV